MNYSDLYNAIDTQYDLENWADDLDIDTNLYNAID